MTEQLRPLSPDDLAKLRRNAAGDLYWDGRRVITTRLTTQGLALIVSAAVALILLLANLDSIAMNVFGSGGETPGAQVNVASPASGALDGGAASPAPPPAGQ